MVGKELLEMEEDDSADGADWDNIDWDKIHEEGCAPLDREGYAKHYEDFPENKKPELIAKLAK